MAIEGHLPMLALHTIPAEQVAAVFERVPVEVFAPEQFEPEPVGGIVTGVLAFVIFDGGSHLPS